MRRAYSLHKENSIEDVTLLIRFIQHIWELGFLLDSGKGKIGRGQEGKQIQSKQGTHHGSKAVG